MRRQGRGKGVADIGLIHNRTLYDGIGGWFRQNGHNRTEGWGGQAICKSL